jgi:hypothetical protein
MKQEILIDSLLLVVVRLRYLSLNSVMFFCKALPDNLANSRARPRRLILAGFSRPERDVKAAVAASQFLVLRHDPLRYPLSRRIMSEFLGAGDHAGPISVLSNCQDRP